MHTEASMPGSAFRPEIQRRIIDDPHFIPLVRQIVCGYFGIEPLAIMRQKATRGGKGPQRATKAKQVMCAVIKQLCPKMSHRQIGEELGGFTPASVLLAIRQVQKECCTDARRRRQIATIIHLVLQRGHESGQFWGRIDKEYYFVDLNDINVMRIDSTQSIVFSGLPVELAERIRQQYFPQSGVEIKEFKGTGLSLFEKR